MKLQMPHCLFVLAFSLLASVSSQAQPQIGPPASTPPAAPSSGMLVRVGPEVTAKAMQDAGYSNVQTTKDKDGRAFARGEVNSVPVNASHEECNEKGCRLVVFWVDFGPQATIDLDYMNAWNRNFRFARLVQDANARVIFIWHVPLYSGVDSAYLRVAATQFASLLKDLLNYTPHKK